MPARARQLGNFQALPRVRGFQEVIVREGKPYRIRRRTDNGQFTQFVAVGAPRGGGPDHHAAKRQAFCSRNGKKVKGGVKGAALHECKTGRRYGK